MNNPQCFEAQPVRLRQVFFHDRPDIPWRNAVQIEHIRNRNPDWLVVHAPLLLA
jgi:hypothetical protein